MPSTSDKQRKFMAAAAHNKQFAKEVGIPQSVAREFNQADKSNLRMSKNPSPPRLPGRKK